MPIVNYQTVVKLNEQGWENLGDPSMVATGGDFTIDLALELSKLYGRNIRQGQNFKVKAVQMAMRPVGSGYDSGLAHTTVCNFVPTTKHSRQAWQQAYRLWKRQQRLFAGATGGFVAYDDLEFAYSAATTTPRTSTVLQSGITDSSDDVMVLTGSSNNSTFALEDYYDSMRPVYPPSVYSWNNNTVKEPKFDQKFPLAREFYVTGNMSTVVTDDSVSLVTNGTNMLSGAQSNADIFEMPEAQNVLCGLMKFQTYVIPDDTAVQIPDSAVLEVAIHVESWKPLISLGRKPRRSRKSRRYTRKSSGSRRSRKGRRNRRYG